MSPLPEIASANFRIENLTVRFGGQVAVDNVSLGGPAGVITGLVGPNGAGKSTTFNACTGVVRPDAGSVYLGEHSLAGESPSRCARAGLGRTFQRVALWETMTVGENVAMGPECRLAGESPIRQLFGRQRDRLACNTVAEEALSQCGILDLMETVVSELSTGQRRLVELARAISSRFSYLLLDEPSSGLDELETEQFGNVLRDVRSQGIGILLVEHDMTLVRQVCEFVYILDFGCLILEGPTAEVLSSEIVRAAYLGTELVEEHA